jgi:hypothetical protein
MSKLVRVPLCIVALLLARCTAPVGFISPCAPGPNPNSNSCQASSPVTQGAISFAPNFDPSNPLTVKYDGQVITGNLSPPPAANGTSTFVLPAPPNPSYYTTPSHMLEADATCGFFCVYPAKTVTFTPPQIGISAAGNNFPNIPVSASLTAPSRAFVVTAPIINSPVSVTLTANPAIVQFMASPGGLGSSTLVVPVTGGEATFYVQGAGGAVVNTTFTITGTAAGCQVGMQSGTITP